MRDDILEEKNRTECWLTQLNAKTFLRSCLCLHAHAEKEPLLSSTIHPNLDIVRQGIPQFQNYPQM